MLGAWEDEWDDILREKFGVPDSMSEMGRDGGVNLVGSGQFRPSPSSADTSSWAGTFRLVDKELEQKVQAAGRRYAELGRKLYRIVVAERELKEKERREAKHERRMARKRAAAAAEESKREAGEEDLDDQEEKSSLTSGYV